MKTKEELIKDLQFYIINFNEFWEDPIEESELVKNTKETCEELISCCSLLNTKIKKQWNKNYIDYPKLVQDTIQNIISLVSDGRDLNHKVTYTKVKYLFESDAKAKESKEYDHHVEENGYLHFENNPLQRTNDIIDTCKELIEVLESTESTKDLQKYVGKILHWENYESGSATIKINKINKTSKGEYTFDGLLITWETVNGKTDADGVLMSEVEDFPFDEIPYAYQDWDNDEEFIESLENAEEYDEKTLRKEVIDTMKNLLDCYL